MPAKVGRVAKKKLIHRHKGPIRITLDFNNSNTCISLHFHLSILNNMDSHRKFGRFGPLIGAIDEGTSSVRFLVFAAQTAEMLTYHQIAIPSNCIQEGWVDQDPLLIWNSIEKCIDKTIVNLQHLEIDPGDMVAIGVSNQRETTIVWDSQTGLPLYNAIVWLDMRTSETVDQLLLHVRNNNTEYFKPICGLPISTYFSAVKLRWLFDNVPEVQKAVKQGRCLFGTMDSWIIWNLTGGVDGGVHITEVTNASRTMLMNLKTLQWDNDLIRFFDIPPEILPKIRSSSEIYGYITKGPLRGLPISGCLGDQQAALVGQMCFKKGQAKCTFGTGCFLLYNTGQAVVNSKHGLLTTVAYKLGRNKHTNYALEGSVAIAGAALNWLRDNLGMIDNLDEMKDLINDTGRIADVVFVPAFSGLYAPYWRKDARSVICGLTDETTSNQLVRAALEAVCFQTRDILDAMNADCHSNICQLLVDGGMTANSFMMQLQADLSGIPVIRPLMTEATSLGAAIAAGLADGVEVWNTESILPVPSDTFYPRMSENERDIYHQKWKKGIERSLGWEVDPLEESPEEILKKVVACGDAPVKPVYPNHTCFARPLRPRKVDKARAIVASIPLGIFMMSVVSLLVIARARSGAS